MSEGRAKELISTGDFRGAAAWLSGKKELTHAERAQLAHTELEIGDPGAAHDQAKSVLRERIDNGTRSYCLSLMGRALRRLGSATDGISFQRKAVALASTVGRDLESELLAYLAIGLLNWVGIEPALAELPRLRRLSLSAGNARALIECHIITARIAAMRGLLRGAEAESKIASALLTSSPNTLQQWKIAQVRSIVAIKSCDITIAKSRALSDLALAEAVGVKNPISTALGNLAHVASMTGDIEEGRQYFERTLRSLDPSSDLLLALYASGIELGLAADDEAFVRNMIESRDRFERSDLADLPYYYLWFELSRTRWLIRSGDFKNAAMRAMAAVNLIEKRADADLLQQMTLLAAEGLACSGELEPALAAFEAVCKPSASMSLETIAELNRVAAILSAAAGSQSAPSLLRRADRILSSAGLHGRRHNVRRTTRLLGVPDVAHPTWAERIEPVETLRAVSAALQLAGHPQALAAEVMWLLRSLGLCHSAVLELHRDGEVEVIDSIEPDPQTNTDLPTSEPIELLIGKGIGSEHRLRMTPFRTSVASLAISAIRQVVHSSIATEQQESSGEAAIALWPEETPQEQFGMVVAAAEMLEVVNTTRRLAPSNIPVLITGESGTGKELLARALHDGSPRKERAFIPFNCSAVARDMLDAQLFGYRRGAFTGAQDAFPGVIRAAAGGTLFLDEIGEITPDVQPKLLRFLESNEIHPLGEPKPIHVDVRVVAATNADLEQMVAEGRFREDLFYRLNVVRLSVPALRERREEIPLLAQHYLEKYRREAQKTGVRISEATMEYLILYGWPGNVRQLANELRRLVALAEPGALLMPEHLSREIAATRRTIPASERDLAPTEFVVQLDQPMVAAMEHVERAMIIHALRLTNNRVEDASQLLGLSRKGLYLKRQRLHIEPSDVLESKASTATAVVGHQSPG